MTLRFRFTLAMLCLGALLWCAVASATTLQRLSVEKMVDAAQIIVRARCVSNEPRWDRGEIWTFTSFEVKDTWKGAPNTFVTVRLLGGTLGLLTSNVSGVPKFNVGDEVILFLEPTTVGDLTVASWEQGTFRIARDTRSGDEVVTQDTAAFEIFEQETRRFRASGIRNVPIGNFRTRVDAAIATAPSRRKR